MLPGTFISFDNPPPPVYLLDAAQSDISAGGRRGEGVPSPLFTVTYPLILQHPPCTLYFSTAEWKVEGAQCLHAVREDWGCPVPQRQSPEVGDHMCSHYPRSCDFNLFYSLLLSHLCRESFRQIST